MFKFLLNINVNRKWWNIFKFECLKLKTIQIRRSEALLHSIFCTFCKGWWSTSHGKSCSFWVQATFLKIKQSIKKNYSLQKWSKLIEISNLIQRATIFGRNGSLSFVMKNYASELFRLYCQWHHAVKFSLFEFWFLKIWFLTLFRSHTGVPCGYVCNREMWFDSSERRNRFNKNFVQNTFSLLMLLFLCVLVNYVTIGRYQ